MQNNRCSAIGNQFGSSQRDYTSAVLAVPLKLACSRVDCIPNSICTCDAVEIHFVWLRTKVSSTNIKWLVQLEILYHLHLSRKLNGPFNTRVAKKIDTY